MIVKAFVNFVPYVKVFKVTLLIILMFTICVFKVHITVHLLISKLAIQNNIR